MLWQYAKWLAILCGALFLIISCSDDNNGVGSVPSETPALYIDETILIDTTAAIHASAQENDRLIFDLDSIPTFKDGDFDDIYIDYFAGDGVDRSNVIFNFDRQSWDTLVSDPGDVYGLMGDVFGHMASKMGLPLGDFINDSVHIYMQPWYLSFGGFKQNPPPLPYTVRGVQLNDHYSPIYIPNSDHVHFTGITYDGQNYQLAGRDNFLWKIWQLSATGEIVNQVDCPTVYPNDMALGDNSLWIIDVNLGSPDSTSWIWRLNYDGDSLCEFSFPSSNIGGIAYGGGHIWLSEDTRGDNRLFCVDPAASCDSGAAVILDTIDVGKPIKSLTWDGTNLMAASDSLYVVSTDGDILDAYAWTVGGDQRISYYDGYLHVFCAGPAGLQLDDRVIVQLKMR